MGVLESDGLEVRSATLGMEAVEREPQREQGERDVVELAEHGDEARDEVDGADDVPAAAITAARRARLSIGSLPRRHVSFR